MYIFGTFEGKILVYQASSWASLWSLLKLSIKSFDIIKVVAILPLFIQHDWILAPFFSCVVMSLDCALVHKQA